MGWYEHSTSPGHMAGDEAHDTVHEFLSNISRLFSQQLGRRPKLEELRLLLQTGLHVSGDEWLADLQERSVEQVEFKTRKKPKNQSFQVGDVFAMPLGSGKVAFGRVMMAHKARGVLVEIFQGSSASFAVAASALTTGRLFQPVLTGSAALKSGRWKVVLPGPTNASPADESDVVFASPGPSTGWVMVDVMGRILRKIDLSEAETMERGWLWPPEDLEDRVSEKLTEPR